MAAQHTETPPRTQCPRTLPRVPGWARIFLALAAFMAAALSSLLLDNIGPFHAWAVSDDPALKNGILVEEWSRDAAGGMRQQELQAAWRPVA